MMMSCFVFSQILPVDSVKNIYEYKKIDDLKKLIGYRLYSIPRVESESPLDYSAVSVKFDDGYKKNKQSR